MEEEYWMVTVGSRVGCSTAFTTDAYSSHPLYVLRRLEDIAVGHHHIAFAMPITKEQYDRHRGSR